MELDTVPATAQERIYIGGLNPPRLSGRDILRRLKSLDRIEIESASIADNGNDASENDYFERDSKPYLHITATSKEESVSALSIIHKHYHNVKWKGCKLVVELAKPHFLERLKQERCDREKRKVEVALVTVSEDQVLNTLEEPNPIPRRLRVRKKHGDTAVHIDTKPWTVETWSRFDKARTKLRQQEAKHLANTIDIANKKHSKDEKIWSPGPLMHRAVHIRFFAEDASSTNLNSEVRLREKNDDASGVISSSESSSSSSISSDSKSESESSIGSSIDKERQSSTKQNSGTYEWSDDDSDIDDSETDNTSMRKRMNDFSKDSEERDHKNKTYHWSTDEESEDDDLENTKSSFLSRDKQKVKPDSGNQEFAAGFDDAPVFSYDEKKKFSDDENSFDLNQVANESVESDLIGDVSTNLNILSSIFPEMAKTKPMKPDSEETSKVHSDSRFSSSDVKKSNSNLGIMPRFDPSAKSSEKYIVKDEKIEEINPLSEEKLDKDAMDEAESDNSEDSTSENDTKTKLPNTPSIYEQDELENVFRNARDAWGVDDTRASMSVNSTNNPNPETSSEVNATSSFGLKLGDADNGNVSNQQTNEKHSGGNAFSFSFNVPDQDSKDATTTSVVNDDSMIEQIASDNIQTEALLSSSNDCDDESAVDDVTQRHKGLTLPDQDLQKYVDHFFGCNGGMRIMQNPQEFMKNEKERVDWNSERQTLTLDWKRKRKYAITRIQKRMKVRR